MCEIMECIGYDAMTPGVEELAIGHSVLFDLLSRHSTLRMVSANVRDLEGRLLFPPYLLIKKDGVVFGVTGVTDSVFYAFRTRDSRRDFKVDDPSRALVDAIASLKGRCDVTVALLHVTSKEAQALVDNTPGIDVAVQSLNPATFGPPGKHVIEIDGKPSSRPDPRLLYPATARAVFSRARILWAQKTNRRSMKLENIRLEELEGEDPRITSIVEDWHKLETLDYDYINYFNRVRDRNLKWLTSGIPWFASRVDQSPESTQVYLEGMNGENLKLVWRGPLTRTQRPLYQRLLDPERLRPLTLASDSELREIPIGSEEEQTLVDLLDFLSASQVSIALRDSILASLQQPGEVVRVRALPHAASALSQLSTNLRYQAAAVEIGDPPYWKRREVVYAKLRIGPKGMVDRVILLENNSSANTIEVFKSRALELSAKADSMRFVLIGMAMDRKEQRFETGLDSLRSRWGHGGQRPPDELLPADAGSWKGVHLTQKLDKDARSSTSMARWLSFWRRLDPKCSWEEFICTPSDMLAGEVHLAGDMESVVYETWKQGRQSLWFGYSTVQHPRFENGTWGHVQVPTVWLQERGEPIQRFQGPMVPTIMTGELRAQLEAMRAKQAKRP